MFNEADLFLVEAEAYGVRDTGGAPALAEVSVYGRTPKEFLDRGARTRGLAERGHEFSPRAGVWLVFAVEGYDVDVILGAAGYSKALGYRVFGETIYIFNADEPFFGYRRDDAAIFDERRGSVMAVVYT
jgi:hypothetical protein